MLFCQPQLRCRLLKYQWMALHHERKIYDHFLLELPHGHENSSSLFWMEHQLTESFSANIFSEKDLKNKFESRICCIFLKFFLSRQVLSSKTIILEQLVSPQIFFKSNFLRFSLCKRGWRKERESLIHKTFVQKRVVPILFSLQQNFFFICIFFCKSKAKFKRWIVTSLI